jgi:hypothetical protein
MKISVITSFNQSYYDQIGKYSVASFLKFWPKDINLICYVENFNIENNDRIIQIPFEDLSPEYHKFQKSEFKNRVKIFSKKAYSIIHAMENIECNFLIWMDADVLTKTEIDNSFLKKICDNTYLCTYMGVEHEHEGKIYFSVESSFFITNKKDKNFDKFSNRYREYYDKKIVKDLRRFYDGEVLGATIKDLKDKNNMNDINLDSGFKSPMPRTILGEKLIHFKAGLKDKLDVDRSAKEICGELDLLKSL